MPLKTINHEFPCLNCGLIVPPAQSTSRNHCPHCFASQHVDETIPGDRASSCQAPMYPVSYEYKGSNIRILFACSACPHTHRNKAASDDEITRLPDLIPSYKRYIFVPAPKTLKKTPSKARGGRREKF